MQGLTFWAWCWRSIQDAHRVTDTCKSDVVSINLCLYLSVSLHQCLVFYNSTQGCLLEFRFSLTIQNETVVLLGLKLHGDLWFLTWMLCSTEHFKDRTMENKFRAISLCAVLCTYGQFAPGDSEPCKICPKGTYQDDGGQSSCKQCGTGLTTAQSGAESHSECITGCPLGYFYNKDSSACESCPYGYYMDKYGAVGCCKACPAHQTTVNKGATSHHDCYSTYSIAFWNHCNVLITDLYSVGS